MYQELMSQAMKYSSIMHNDKEMGGDFQDLCRLCGSSDANEKVNLFSDEGRNMKLKEKIQMCLPLKVEENDHLPKQICMQCLNKLENSYKFRYNCIKINHRFEKQLKEELERKDKIQTVRRIHPEVSIFPLPSTSQTSNNHNVNVLSSSSHTHHVDSDDTPNPMDFLEVGVSDDSVQNGFIRKQIQPWSIKKNSKNNQAKSFNCQNMVDDYANNGDENGLSRRKNNNPRKIARDGDNDDVVKLELNSTTYKGPPPLISITNVSSLSSSSTTQATTSFNRPNARASTSTTISHPSAEDENVTYSCLLCDQNFKTRAALSNHFSNMHGIDPYNNGSEETEPTVKQEVNEEDAGSISTTLDFSDIMAVDNSVEQGVVICEVCRREFQDRANLWLHMVHAHREEASLSCGICLKIFTDSITLIEHVNTAHAGERSIVQRRYACQVCGRQHDSRQKLLKHAAIHTLIDNQGQAIQPEEMISLNNAYAPRDCPICHRKFFTQDKLEQHIQNLHNDSQASAASTAAAAFASAPTSVYQPPSNTIIYKCELCDSTHATRSDRWWHMFHSHGTDSRVVCNVGMCNKIFVTQAIREEHVSAHHSAQGEFTNTCEICGKLWETRIFFYKHMMNVHPKCLPSVCGVCMKIFSNVPELRKHVSAEHAAIIEKLSKTAILCDVCGRAYAERSKMLRHRRVHNVNDGALFTPSMMRAQDDLQCSICPDLIFETSDAIAEHRRSVHQLFVCDLCPKFYNGNNHLWKHVSKLHKGDPNVTCDICFKTSASRAHLYRHKLKYHADPIIRLAHRTSSATAGVGNMAMPSVPRVIHRCDLCGREFRIPSLLNKHAKSCKGVKPVVPKIQQVNRVYPCEKCTRVFNQQSLLNKHVKKIHVVYTCEGCGEQKPEQFDRKTDLMQHIREKHADDPDFFCNVDGCNKAARIKVDMLKHKTGHLRGHITYVCDCCGDTFTNRKKLRKHLLTIHKGDNVDNICAICVEILPTVEDLMQHVQTVHPTLMHRPFTCQICGKCLSTSSKAVDHVIKSHGGIFRPCKICWKVFSDENILNEHVENHPPIEEKPNSSTLKRDATSRLSFSSEPSRMSTDFPEKDDDEDDEDGADNHVGEHFSPSDDVVLDENDFNDDDDDDEDDGEEGEESIRYECNFCKEVFYVSTQLENHVIEKHNEQNSSSYIEDNEIDDNTNHFPIVKGEFNENMEKNEFGSDEYIDEIVGNVNKRSINSYKPRWTEACPSVCDCCGRIWNSKKQLWQHLIRSHVVESMTTCGICLKVCPTYNDLFCHLDEFHVNSPGLNDRFACTICAHHHNSQCKLNEHIKHHRNVPALRLQTCKVCDKVFKTDKFFRKHEHSNSSVSSDTAPEQSPASKSPGKKESEFCKANPVNVDKNVFKIRNGSSNELSEGEEDSDREEYVVETEDENQSDTEAEENDENLVEEEDKLVHRGWESEDEEDFHGYEDVHTQIKIEKEDENDEMENEMELVEDSNNSSSESEYHVDNSSVNKAHKRQYNDIETSPPMKKLKNSI